MKITRMSWAGYSKETTKTKTLLHEGYNVQTTVYNWIIANRCMKRLLSVHKYATGRTEFRSHTVQVINYLNSSANRRNFQHDIGVLSACVLHNAWRKLYRRPANQFSAIGHPTSVKSTESLQRRQVYEYYNVVWLTSTSPLYWLLRSDPEKYDERHRVQMVLLQIQKHYHYCNMYSISNGNNFTQPQYAFSKYWKYLYAAQLL